MTNTVTGSRYRFTVLTNRLIRLEYQEHGHFEDRRTQMVWERSFPEVHFKATENGKGVMIET